ncbi:hypothetical protein IWW52_004724 [Coemansia sp. RSA 2704]|nr:hypothetical protein IWW52_004724 [Coemansia sp. RSA 2704]
MKRKGGKTTTVKANAKAPEPRVVKTAGPPVPVLLSIVVGLTSTNILASSLLRLGPQYLEPVYGNVLPRLGFTHSAVISMVLGSIIGSSYWRRICRNTDTAATSPGAPLTLDTRTGRAIAAAFDIAAILTALAPLRATYLFRWSDTLGPMWGPLLTQCALTFPVLILGGFAATIGAARISHSQHSAGRRVAATIACLGAVAVLIWIGQQFVSPQRSCHGVLLNAGYAALSSLMIKLLTGYQEDLDAAAALETLKENEKSAPVVRSRRLRFLPTVAWIALAATAFFSDPACTTGVAVRGSSGIEGFTTLYRNESTTGWVTVADEGDRSLRLLRSGHSLIGGHWKATSESIFGIFYYADAVRMIRGRKNNPAAKRLAADAQPTGWTQTLSRRALIGDGSERALQIGLGVGVSARLLHSQNVRVDVVEIDPAVHEAAVKFFKLPKKLNAVHIMDGRRFIDEAPASTYDYIIHDVFTGGSVPPSLFSQSAVSQLRRILSRDGVLAMNYVGVPSDRRTLSHVARTIGTAFPHVRCFVEATEDMDRMANMMFFASAEPLAFDITPDLLRLIGRDTIRARVLGEMLRYELDISSFVADAELRPITDDWNPLSEWQVGTAIEHWHAMRRLLPTGFWLNY